MSESRTIIRQRALVAAPALPASPDLDPAWPGLDAWLRKVGAGETAPNALWLGPNDDPLRLAGQIQCLATIAVHFPKFVEGRGYSIAYLLRSRLGYRGELRAFGDLGRDHLWQLARVGFDSFDLRDGTDLADALNAFDDFPERYQASVDCASPLFRRQEPAHA